MPSIGLAWSLCDQESGANESWPQTWKRAPCRPRPSMSGARTLHTCCPLWNSQKTPQFPGLTRWGDRIRTCNLRFWRPTLNQLSYTPISSYEEAALSGFRMGGFKISDLELPVARVALIGVDAEPAGFGHGRSAQLWLMPPLRCAAQHDLLLLDRPAVELRADEPARQPYLSEVSR